MSVAKTLHSQTDGVRKSRHLGRYLFFVPAVLLMLLFFVIPIFLTFILSFTNSSLTGAGSQQLQFVGIENYRKMLTDPVVKISVVNTLIFLAGCLFGQQFLGFVTAYLMKNKGVVFRRVIGALIICGWVMPEIIVAFCMMTFFGDSGTLNQILGIFHMKAVSWLYRYSMLSVMIANVWHGTAFSMLIYQTALDEVPKEIEEAAIVDGASGWSVLTRITLPYIKGAISTSLILNTLQTMGVFTLIYTITGGGPGNTSTTLPIFMYNQAFMSSQIGYGTAIAMILLAIGILLSLFYVKAMKVQH